MTTFPQTGDVFGRYEITGELGRGGMGVVFSAMQLDLGRMVALKVLAPQLASDARFRSRFTREANALAQLDSPHIVRIYDHGENDGCLFMATQLVTGGDLRELLDEKDEGLAPALGIGIVADVTAAVVDAHAAGVIHRDIKPANVLLRRSTDGETFAYLADFGIAQTDRGETTWSGGVPGTLGYLAPERQQGASATVASDIYSLGCLLWAALTGRPPYHGSDVEVLMAHLRAPIPALPGDDRVTKEVNAVLRRSMAKRPEQRYSSAAEMRTNLLALAALAAADTHAAATRAGNRRGRPLLATAAVAAVALVAASLALAAALLRDPAPAGDPAALGSSPGPDVTSDPPEPVTCWDHTRADRVGQCSTPGGEPGLRWVFPTFDRDYERCRKIAEPVAPGKLKAWFCPFANNRTEGVRYSEWISAQDARRAARDDYKPHLGQSIALGDGASLLYWRRRSLDESGFLSAAIAYRNWPFTADVQSTTDAGVDAGCAWVEVRSPSTFKPVKDVCGKAS